MGTIMGVVGGGTLILWADHLLRRKLMRAIKRRWYGWKITSEIFAVVNNQGHVAVQELTHIETKITPHQWWKCILPWPGKRKWAETVLAKAALLGAIPKYQAVSAWDWDEAWVIEVDPENVIASSNRTATALAYLIYRGVPET